MYGQTDVFAPAPRDDREGLIAHINEQDRVIRARNETIRALKAQLQAATAELEEARGDSAPTVRDHLDRIIRLASEQPGLLPERSRLTSNTLVIVVDVDAKKILHLPRPYSEVSIADSPSVDTSHLRIVPVEPLRELTDRERWIMRELRRLVDFVAEHPDVADNPRLRGDLLITHLDALAGIEDLADWSPREQH